MMALRAWPAVFCILLARMRTGGSPLACCVGLEGTPASVCTCTSMQDYCAGLHAAQEMAHTGTPVSITSRLASSRSAHHEGDLGLILRVGQDLINDLWRVMYDLHMVRNVSDHRCETTMSNHYYLRLCKPEAPPFLSACEHCAGMSQRRPLATLWQIVSTWPLFTAPRLQCWCCNGPTSGRPNRRQCVRQCFATLRCISNHTPHH